MKVLHVITGLEVEALDGWVSTFEGKYLCVGELVEEEEFRE